MEFFTIADVETSVEVLQAVTVDQLTTYCSDISNNFHFFIELHLTQHTFFYINIETYAVIEDENTLISI